MFNVRKSVVLGIFFSIMLFELLSYFTFLQPNLQQIIFLFIVFIVLYLTLKKLSYGLIFLISELAIGSFGYIFSLPVGNFVISIRIAIWFIVLFVWFLNFVRNPKFYIQIFKNNKKILLIFALLFVFLLIALVIGLVRNEIVSVFYDFNSWLYLLLFLPWLFFDKNYLLLLWETLVSASLWLFLKTTFLLYIFSHQFTNLSQSLYLWTRDYRLGEITYAGGNFWRIFLQSQNFILFMILVLSAFILLRKNQNHNKEFYFNGFILFSSFVTIIISYSRSFWLAMVVTFFLLILFAWKKYGFKYVWPKFILCMSIGALSLMFVYAVVNFPYPRISGSTGLIMSRLQNASGEAAGSSRLNQLKPLGQAIRKSPLIGSGFATTVTYLSNDPRIKAMSVNQSGWYTTYSFEWGYLDIWLKIGLFGLGVYIWFISMLILKAYNNNQLFSYTLIFGVISIIIANVTTPYLNHPLGIGLLFILLVGNHNMYETV